MHDEIKHYMDDMEPGIPCGFESVEKDHGRLETRRCWQTEEIGWFADTRQ
jgi:hypothetical protein